MADPARADKIGSLGGDADGPLARGEVGGKGLDVADTVLEGDGQGAPAKRALLSLSAAGT